MKRIAIIDADELLYNISFRYQKSTFSLFNGDMLISEGYPNKTAAIESIGNDVELDYREQVHDRLFGKSLRAKEIVFQKDLESRISGILKAIGRCHEYILCLNGDNNFRYKLATLTPYKETRPISKPVHHKVIRTVAQHMKAQSVKHLESDDLMVVLANELKWKGYDPIICSSDKDLKTVEGWNYDISKGKFQYINEATALYNFYYQVLVGDITDTIPSPYGIGPKSAVALLEEAIWEDCPDLNTHLFNRVYTYYDRHLHAKYADGRYKTRWFKGDKTTLEVITEVANLLYMHRTRDEEERWEAPEVYNIKGSVDQAGSEVEEIKE